MVPTQQRTHHRQRAIETDNRTSSIWILGAIAGKDPNRHRLHLIQRIGKDSCTIYLSDSWSATSCKIHSGWSNFVENTDYQMSTLKRHTLHGMATLNQPYFLAQIFCRAQYSSFWTMNAVDHWTSRKESLVFVISRRKINKMWAMWHSKVGAPLIRYTHCWSRIMEMRSPRQTLYASTTQPGNTPK